MEHPGIFISRHVYILIQVTGRNVECCSLHLDRVKKKQSEAAYADARGIFILTSNIYQPAVDTFPVTLMKDFSRLDVQ
jgi:hypothetical protein